LPDAVVVGAGPNGLAAAIALARAGRSVRVLEAAATVGGGARSAELTLPGFVHDVCSAVHPHPLASPFLRELPLERHGLELVHPGVPLAHPLDDGTAVLLERHPGATTAEPGGAELAARSVADTAASIGGADGRAYERMLGPLVRDAEKLLPAILSPLRPTRHPLALTRFGALGLLRPVDALARARFEGPRGRALLAGLAAHSMLRLDERPTAAVALVLALTAHAVGWPVARGGSQRMADALTHYLRSLGGEVETGRRVQSVDELGDARTLMLDVTPRQVLALAGHRLPARYRRELSRFRYGPGVFKLDWALDGPIPWRAAECARAGTVHVGGTLEEIAASEAAVVAGRIPEHPYVLLAQQSSCDPTRAPAGRHTGWGYCHVPNGCDEDMTERIEAQVERFAPGFRDRILARAALGPAALERYDANYVGGDINGGRQDLRQLFTRPVIRPVPYATPDPRIYICSSSTPPGGGVHGMCGYHAAQAALRR
jgi:phytoene dehydrogenase-like protein